ncbi:hypothetical protein [Ureaplasma zalophigenitalium]|uniref:Transmembrane protein n=1 Tax=Ureaplasma zalophigenitalium TaxID=907723 RepID=A0ABT3BP48_9BACT|nr:hypothetical protein [Ureaplasma zalophigenitalium]MCV3754037.1 hypothetical protein [Ureaplasma zalophigenitalium]
MNYTSELTLQASNYRDQKEIATKYVDQLINTKKRLQMIQKTSIICTVLFFNFVIFIALFANSHSIVPSAPYKALAGFGFFAFALLFVYVGFLIFNLINIMAILRNFAQLQNSLQNFFNHEQPKKSFREYVSVYIVLLFFFPICASTNLLKILNNKEENQLNHIENILGYELLISSKKGSNEQTETSNEISKQDFAPQVVDDSSSSQENENKSH